eukprot:gene7070-9650_t
MQTTVLHLQTGHLDTFNIQAQELKYTETLDMQQLLCGDEVRAAIIDVGSCTCKFGTAGQDLPRHIFRSELGKYFTEDQQINNIYGDTGLRMLRSDLEITNLCPSSTNKAEHIENLISHGLKNCMRIDPAEYPLIISKNNLINDDATSSKVLEYCFENLSSPGLYMASGSTLSSFSLGRPTSLVIDISASGTNITPVVDGYEMRNASISTHRGGNYMDSLIRNYIQTNYRYDNSNSNISSNSSNSNYSKALFEIKPWFEINTNKIIPSFSFKEMHINDICKDLKHWMCFSPYTAYDTPEKRLEYFQDIIKMPPPYTLPDGTIIHAEDSLCTIPEKVFFSKNPPIIIHSINDNTMNLSVDIVPQATTPMEVALGLQPKIEQQSNKKRSRSGSFSHAPHDVLNQSTDSNNNMNSGGTSIQNRLLQVNNDESMLHELVFASLSRCDIDVRKELVANIMLVGGGALIDGVAQRLTYELNEIIPSNYKVKLIPSLPMEKQNAAWIGGSILGICGTFQQLWLSKAEYDEYGVDALNDRFDH